MRRQYLSRPDVKEYLERFPDVTQAEKAALMKWLKEGNSPYDNGDCLYTESGCSMDFISTLRFWDDLYDEWKTDPEGFMKNHSFTEEDSGVFTPMSTEITGGDLQ